MKGVLVLAIVGLVLALLGLRCINKGRTDGDGGLGVSLFGVFAIFLGVVFILIALAAAVLR